MPVIRCSMPQNLSTKLNKGNHKGHGLPPCLFLFPQQSPNSIVTFQHPIRGFPIKFCLFLLGVLTKPRQQILHLVNPQIFNVLHRKACVLDQRCKQITPMRFLAGLYFRFFLKVDRPRSSSTICAAVSRSSHSLICSLVSR